MIRKIPDEKTAINVDGRIANIVRTSNDREDHVERRVLFLVERQRESDRVHPTHHPNASKLSMSVPDSFSLLEKDSDVSHEIDATTVNHYYVPSVNTRRVARDRTYTNI